MVRSPRLILLACLALAAGCKQNVSTTSTPASGSAPAQPPAPPQWAEKTSFADVTKHLDAGGNVYGYLSTEQFLLQSGSKASVIRDAILGNLPPAAQTNRAQLEHGLAVAGDLYLKSGIGELSGVGISSVALEPGFYQTRFMLHHYPDKGTGALWKLSGGQTTAANILSYLPQTTALAASSDADPAILWNLLQDEAATMPELQAFLTQASAQVQQVTQLPLPQIVAGLGPQFAMVLTLDESRKTTLPSPNPITIPEPGLAFLVEAKDPAVLAKTEQLVAGIQGIQKSESDGVRFYILPVPAPLPYVRPTMAVAGSTVIIGSFEALVREMLAVKAGTKPGLAALPAYQACAKGLPAQVASFRVVAPSLGRAISEIQAAGLKSQNNPSIDAVTKAFDLQGSDRFSIAVTENLPDGVLMTAHGPNGSAPIFAAAGVAPVALLAGIAVPNFQRARLRSQATRTLEDARMLDAAVDQWAIENNKSAGAQPTVKDLLPYLKTGSSLHSRMLQSTDNMHFPAEFDAGAWTVPAVDSLPQIPAEAVQRFAGVAGADFWKPYGSGQ